MAAQIIEQDDVARVQGWYQHLLDIGAEALAIDRTIEDAWRSDPAAAQTSDQGWSPSNAREATAPTAASRGRPGHIGRAMLVVAQVSSINQTVGIERRLAANEGAARLGYIGDPARKRAGSFRA